MKTLKDLTPLLAVESANITVDKLDEKARWDVSGYPAVSIADLRALAKQWIEELNTTEMKKIPEKIKSWEGLSDSSSGYEMAAITTFIEHFFNIEEEAKE